MKPLLAACALCLTACFSVAPPEGRYFCEDDSACLDGFTCYEGYCCQKERFTGLCVDHPCLIEGADEDRDGFPVCADDCDDADATSYPGAPELCDAKDNNCDGTIDEGATLPRYLDRDGDGHGSNAPEDAVFVCADGPNISTNRDDCDDGDAARYGGAEEICDGKDNDCDLQIDEDVTARWYLDGDGDGYGVTATFVDACERPAGYAALSGDCQDASPLIHPNQDEVCNDFDDDCDGATDEDVKQIFFPDTDADGFGDENSKDGVSACVPPAGYAANQADCNDGDALIHPGVAERCNGQDDDCDGAVDEGITPTWYQDLDGDTWGGSITMASCLQPGGYVARTGDCKDQLAAINPAAPESCNQVDDDCDGLIDEGLQLTYFQDADGDGYGNPASSKLDCPTTMGAGWVGNALDCDDARASAWPGAPELCDGVDNDCDGAKDNVPLCGPRADQAEVAGAWGGADNTLTKATATVSGCIANSVHAIASPPQASTTMKVAGAAAIQLDSVTGKDFLLYYPAQRSAAWDLRGQRLHLEVAGIASAWGTAFRQPVILFCSANGKWARFEPNPSMLASGFAPLEVTIPPTYAQTGGFSYASGFNWQTVDWIEVHAAPAAAGASSLYVDDFRFLTP